MSTSLTEIYIAVEPVVVCAIFIEQLWPSCWTQFYGLWDLETCCLQTNLRLCYAVERTHSS